MKFSLLAAVVMCVISGDAYARPRRSYNYSMPSCNTQNYSNANNMSVVSMNNSGSDQERCQAEADYMAANHISGHVWGCIGRFEGVGCGHSPDCNTCTPGCGMTPTGDACAQGRNGMWYRVRSWR